MYQHLFPTIEAYEMPINRRFQSLSARNIQRQTTQRRIQTIFHLLQKEFQKIGLRVYRYAMPKSDRTKDTENASRLQLVHIAYSKLHQATSFEEPELIALGKERFWPSSQP